MLVNPNPAAERAGSLVVPRWIRRGTRLWIEAVMPPEMLRASPQHGVTEP